MELELEFTFEAAVAPSLMLGNGPYGTRAIGSITGGWVKGDRISGTLVGAGGDWALIGPDGYGRIDVRAQIQTDDGAFLYLTYCGLLEVNEKVIAATVAGSELAEGAPGRAKGSGDSCQSGRPRCREI